MQIQVICKPPNLVFRRKSSRKRGKARAKGRRAISDSSLPVHFAAQETESETAQFTQQVKLNSGMGLFVCLLFKRSLPAQFCSTAPAAGQVSAFQPCLLSMPRTRTCCTARSSHGGSSFLIHIKLLTPRLCQHDSVGERRGCSNSWFFISTEGGLKSLLICSLAV